MAIKINNQDLQARYINGNSIGKVMLNGGQIRPETIPPRPDPNEYIMYTINAKYTHGKYYVFVPTSGMGHDGNYGVPYDWSIYVRHNSLTPRFTEERAGTSAWSSCIAFEVSKSGLYYVTIRPRVSSGYGWALAYSWEGLDTAAAWDGLNVSAQLYSVNYDPSYIGYAVSATHTGDYFRGRQYMGTTISTPPAEVLPDTVTTIGNFFRYEQYRNGSAWNAPTEVMPNSVISIGDSFRENQYYNAHPNAIGNEVISNNVTSIGNYFRKCQYVNCTYLTSVGNEALPSGCTSIGNYFRYQQFWRCSALTTSAAESLPNTVTSIGTNFREMQYADSDIATVTLWKDLSIGNTDYRHDQFYGCGPTTMTVEGDVGYPTAFDDDTSTYAHWVYSLTQINVPSQYLTNYQTTSVRPRYLVYPKSIFIGY